MKQSVLIILALIICGCVAGGGSTQNTTPNEVVLGTTGYKIAMDCTVWGSEPVNLEKRFTDMKLNYVVMAKGINETVDVVYEGMQNGRLKVYGIIPKNDKIVSGDKLSCAFKFKLDSHENSTPIFTIAK